MQYFRPPSHLVSLCIALWATAIQAQSTPAVPSLHAQVQAIANDHHGAVTMYAENLRTHETVAILPETPVQTASVIKLAILYEALEQVRAGKVHFDDPVRLAAADQVTGSGVLRLFDAPLSLTFKDVLTMMIVMSDNTATNLAIDHLGLENINGRVARLGLKDTYLYKKVFTPPPAGMVMPADQKRFGLGKTTAREMSTLMKKIVSCDLAEAGSPARAGDATLCDVAVKMLHLQFYRSSIPRYLDAMPGATSDSIANKTGALDAVRNDVAAVSTRNGMLMISIFTFDNQDHSWGVDHEAELTIAKLAQAVVQRWSPEGLAPWPATQAAPLTPPK